MDPYLGGRMYNNYLDIFSLLGNGENFPLPP